MLKKIVIVLILVLWPINLVVNKSDIHPSGETIFTKDYEAEQLIIRNIHLYPDVILARTFQNKAKIYIERYVGSFFVLIDPNNYFFALHPEPLRERANIFKYPFLSIVFFAIGIYYINKSKYQKLIIPTLIPLVFILPIFKNFEGVDFLLYFPISLLIINGVNVFWSKNKRFFNWFSIVFILFTIPEIIRSFIK